MAKDGTVALGRAGRVGEEGEGDQSKRHLLPGIAPHSHPLWPVPHQVWRVRGQELQGAALPLPTPPDSCPGLSRHLLSSFLPAFPFFLSPHLTDCGSKMAQIYGSTHQK